MMAPTRRAAIPIRLTSRSTGRWSSISPAPSGSPSASAPSQPLSAAASVSAAGSTDGREPAPQVTIRIEADEEIVEVRLPEANKIEIDGKTARFIADRGERPISMHVRFSDGSAIDETVVPNAAALIRVRKPTVSGAKGLGARPLPSADNPPTLRYEKSPYE